MTRTLASVAGAVRGRLIGADAAFAAVSTDTRSIEVGALYVAIAGDRFDGNDFVADAEARGAAGALVSRTAELRLPQVVVDDTRRAFGAMAHAWRSNFQIPVVAVTGSAGKTTVKELIASILGVRARVCVTRGNLNNDIGVPLTLMQLGAEHDAAVIELGANHAGEIDYLASIVEPTVGVITLAGAAHLEGFGSVAGVAAAKGELLDHLPRAGTSVLNADDPYFSDWRTRARTEYVVSFGVSPSADCGLEGEPAFEAGITRFRMRLPDATRLDIALPLVGLANVCNALAAAAAAQAAGASTEDIRTGLERARSVQGRMKAVPGQRGAKIIDDSYNANPTAARAALDYLASLPGQRILVLGDMAELGAEAAELHAEVGRYARSRCDALYTLGKLAAGAAAACGDSGHACDDIGQLEAAIEPLLGPDVTVLVKGSRIMALDRLVDRLTDPATREESSC